MGRVEQFIENSTVARALDMIERGEGLDVEALARRQVLESVRLGQVAMLEAHQSELEADELAMSMLKSLVGMP